MVDSAGKYLYFIPGIYLCSRTRVNSSSQRDEFTKPVSLSSESFFAEVLLIAVFNMNAHSRCRERSPSFVAVLLFCCHEAQCCYLTSTRSSAHGRILVLRVHMYPLIVFCTIGIMVVVVVGGGALLLDRHSTKPGSRTHEHALDSYSQTKIQVPYIRNRSSHKLRYT